MPGRFIHHVTSSRFIFLVIANLIIHRAILAFPISVSDRNVQRSRHFDKSSFHNFSSKSSSLDYRSSCTGLQNRNAYNSFRSSTLYEASLERHINSSSVYIRKPLYSDLGKVADILINSFYNPSSIVRPYLFLSELSRLQGNFPYDDDKHTFFIACVSDEESETIIGFVDVDTRPRKKENDAPRPYLSDLAVRPLYRRKGAAKKLIQNCESVVKEWGHDKLYLRVERKNNAALKMYKDLGYESLEHPYFGVKDTTILLKRDFIESHEDPELVDDIIDSRRISQVVTNVKETASYTYVI